MKGRPIGDIVYEHMFPKPKPTDPQNFQGLLQRQLVPEVRLETQAFYGHLLTQEARYPGLDYSHMPHRRRLSRFQWHRRLFRAFDNLGLTEHEIAGLTKWEGTRWARERYEKEQGVVIKDTTADGIEEFVPEELRITVPQALRADVEDMEDIQEDPEAEENDTEEEGEVDLDSDTEIQSVGADLNERLRAAAAQRESGNTGAIMDEEWEQWLKNVLEAGGQPFMNNELSPNAHVPGTRPVPHIPQELRRAVREGQLPDTAFRDMPASLLEALALESRSSQTQNDTSTISTASQATNLPPNRGARSRVPPGPVIIRTPIVQSTSQSRAGPSRPPGSGEAHGQTPTGQYAATMQSLSQRSMRMPAHTFSPRLTRNSGQGTAP